MADIQPNKKTSEEPSAGAITGVNLFRVVQGSGTTDDPYVSRKVTASVLASYFAGSSDTTTVGFVNDTGTTYVYGLDDAGKVIRHDNASDITATIALNADIPFPITKVITSRQVGAGQVTIVGATGVTINVPAGAIAKTRAKGSVVMLHHVADDEWDLTGDLATS